ncbi:MULTISPECIES: aldo/keto reductase [Bacillus]|uniref:aldo/keto reductase n=1 Tax=Bacillus TaxID=1386 RepID=UPI000BB6E711|nr:MULTISPECIES: aldo/keto reductase [Bacillus]
MRKMALENLEISSSRLILGCMGLGGGWDNSSITKEHIKIAEEAVEMALSTGITMFDHADIYTRGKAERVFGEVLKIRPNLREQIEIQSKCGIRFDDDKGPGRYDFSKGYIVDSVDGILNRLNTDYLDIFLLHRPDPLLEPEEVAEAFHQLRNSGKVNHFGVSNMNKSQMQLLEAYIDQPLVVNQLEMSLNKLDWVDQGVHVNQKAGESTHFADGLIEHCMLHNVQIQAWSPLAKGIFSGNKMDNMSDAEKNTALLVEKMADEKETSKEAIVLGWLMRHPAKVQPVIGTSNPIRIKNCAEAVRQSVLMTREEWYSLYVTARGNRLP